MLLQERTASATLEDDEEELEDDEADADDRVRRTDTDRPPAPGEFLCSSCFLVLPRNQLADEKRSSARLRLTPATAARLPTGHASAVVLASRASLAGFCFPPFDLGPLIVVALVPLLWAWRDTRPAPRGALRLRVRCRLLRVVLEWIRYFGVVAIVPLVAVMALARRGRRRVVALLGRRGIASPSLTAAVGSSSRRSAGRGPLGGFPWADVGVALHDLAPARALAELGGVPLVSFVVGGVRRASLLDASSRGTPAAPAWRRRSCGLGVVGMLVVVAVADVTRYEPTPTGTLRFALLQGDDEELPLAQQSNPAAHRRRTWRSPTGSRAATT